MENVAMILAIIVLSLVIIILTISDVNYNKAKNEYVELKIKQLTKEANSKSDITPEEMNNLTNLLRNERKRLEDVKKEIELKKHILDEGIARTAMNNTVDKMKIEVAETIIVKLGYSSIQTFEKDFKVFIETRNKG